MINLPLFPSGQTLYKTQIRELKEEYDDNKKLGKNMKQRLAEYEEERLVSAVVVEGPFLIHSFISATCAKKKKEKKKKHGKRQVRSITQPTWDGRITCARNEAGRQVY